MKLADRFGRTVDSLRLVLTNKCNYNCFYCHREGVLHSVENELSRQDWRFLVETAVELGIRSFKITGGEPFIREDAVDIARDIVNAGGEVSIVTNASLIGRYIDKLAEVGIDHVNVSLLSLNPERYSRLTGGKLGIVLKNIDELLSSKIRVKANYVVLRENICEYIDIINYAVSKGIDLNIIELIPLGVDPGTWREMHVTLDPIVKYLEEKSTGRYTREFQSRPVYLINNIEVTVIKGYCNPELCAKCTRLRVTPDGYLKTCLYTNTYVDARKYILSRDREGLIKAFIEAVEKREPFFKTNYSRGVY